jgi:hypothetical protein
LTEFLTGNPPFTFKGIYCSCRIKERLNERKGIPMHGREAKGEITGYIYIYFVRKTDVYE